MRYVRIFLLEAQYALVYKSRSLVWFLVALINATLYLLFWRGTLLHGNEGAPWSLSAAVSYYLLLIIAGSFLHVHIEEKVAFEDIQQGGLSAYLTRPFSYAQLMFLHELPWRLVQGFLGMVVLFAVYQWFAHIPLVSSWIQLLPVLLVVLIGYILTFIFKMIIGITSFWLTDFSGIHNLEAIVFLLLGGFVMPLDLFPEGLRSVALAQPMAYMIYYPVRAMQGYFDLPTLGRIAVIQLVWLIIFLTIYKRLWAMGVKRFTGVGQ